MNIFIFSLFYLNLLVIKLLWFNDKFLKVKRANRSGFKFRFCPIHTCPFFLDPLFAEHPAILPFLASGSKMQRMRQQKLSCILASVKVSLFLKLFLPFIFFQHFFFPFYPSLSYHRLCLTVGRIRSGTSSCSMTSH